MKIEATITSTGVCFCIGPQKGETLCPCMLRRKRQEQAMTSRIDIIGQNGNTGDHYKYKREHEQGAENYDIRKQEDTQMDMVVLTRGEAGYVLDMLRELKDLDTDDHEPEAEEAILIMSSAIDNTVNIKIIADEEEDEDSDNIGNSR